MPTTNQVLASTLSGKATKLMPLSLVVTVVATLVYFSARLSQVQTHWGTGNEGMAALALLALFFTLLGLSGLTLSLYQILRAVEAHLTRPQD